MFRLCAILSNSIQRGHVIVSRRYDTKEFAESRTDRNQGETYAVNWLEEEGMIWWWFREKLMFCKETIPGDFNGIRLCILLIISLIHLGYGLKTKKERGRRARKNKFVRLKMTSMSLEPCKCNKERRASGFFFGHDLWVADTRLHGKGQSRIWWNPCWSESSGWRSWHYVWRSDSERAVECCS